MKMVLSMAGYMYIVESFHFHNTQVNQFPFSKTTSLKNFECTRKFQFLVCKSYTYTYNIISNFMFASLLAMYNTSLGCEVKTMFQNL